MGEETPVCGMVLVFVDDKGRTICHAADFEGGYAGFTRRQSQTMRAKDQLARSVIEAYASPQLSRALTGDRYKSLEVLNTLVNYHDCKVVEIPVGYPAEQSA